MAEKCKKKGIDGADCNQWNGGYLDLCWEHLAYYKRLYPQGWKYSPGDTCKHGTYVGGMGIDHMCHWCEIGD
jgi:hypothetical protein